MTSFLTQCPHCQTSFKLSEAQLDIAQGKVRCGACLVVFSALAHRIIIKEPINAESMAEFSAADPELATETGQQHKNLDTSLESGPTFVANPNLLVLSDDKEHFDPLFSVDQIDEISLGDMQLDDEYPDDEEDVHEQYSTKDNQHDNFVDREHQDEPTLDSDEDEDEDEDTLTTLPFHPTDERVFTAKQAEPNSTWHNTAADTNPSELHSEDKGLIEPGFLKTPDDELLNSNQTSVKTAYRASSDDPEPIFIVQPKLETAQDKQVLRTYLADLEHEDALEALAPELIEAIDADPLTLELGSTLYKRMTSVALFVICLILVAVFVLQVVANNLDALQKSPRYADVLPLFCRVLACPEPTVEPTNTTSLYSQQLLVRSHPRVANALELNFIFRNDSEQPQAFPQLELSFSDPNNTLLANRLFEPAQYLPPELAVMDAMPARSSVQIQLELVDPGSNAVNYRIEFR